MLSIDQETQTDFEECFAAIPVDRLAKAYGYTNSC